MSTTNTRKSTKIIIILIPIVIAGIILGIVFYKQNGVETSTAETELSAKKSADAHNVHWGYEGDEGPEHWGELDPTFAVCADGKEQSPINIVTSNTQLNDSVQLEIHYESTSFTLMNNGNTIQANPTTESNFIELDGERYNLLQFHFHQPSEHQFEGKNLAMEMHFVHKNESGDLAVIGVLINEGMRNTALANVWTNLPDEKTEHDLKLDEPVDLVKLLPDDQTKFRYNGSLTTPPCSEGVRWIVFKDAIELSKEQIEAFGEIYPNNNRPVQSLNERGISSE